MNRCTLVLVIDGVYVEDNYGKTRFYPIKAK
jgi:hypothetical protein